MPKAPWWTLPYQGYTYQGPPAPQSLGILGKIHEAIDPVKALGGYGGVAAMVLPPGTPENNPLNVANRQPAYGWREGMSKEFYQDYKMAKNSAGIRNNIEREIATKANFPADVTDAAIRDYFAPKMGKGWSEGLKQGVLDYAVDFFRSGKPGRW